MNDELQTFEQWYNSVSAEIESLKTFSKKECINDGYAIDAVMELTRQYLARSGELLAKAEYYYLQERAEAINRLTQGTEKISPSILRLLAESEVRHIKLVYTGLDRLNATLTHALPVLATRLSYVKKLLDFPG
jgi:hypothetical protein